ncbi:MAG: CCA tRNA nucleotidyltransferase [Methanobacteriota archaeon]|nr:MAG: CCA tRNA nucleotidyltransferase [Euryarchaeota archaeon]
MRQIEREVLSRIKPSAQEDRRMTKAVAKLSEAVRAAAAEIGAHIELKLVGSVAKGTHMKDPDIDLFMMFPESTPPEELRDKGLEIGRKVLGGEEHYAQHPYIRGAYDGYQVDLVPCFLVKDPQKKMSAVDRTPFHTEFVADNLERSLHDHVRLLKRFMKGIGCYGAEAKTQGFSGYLCELLVMRFGDFDSVLKAASEWTMGQALALPEYPGIEFSESLTFVDPIDSGRNVASAVSPASMMTFMKAARAYMKKADLRFFYPREQKNWDVERIREEAGERIESFLVVSFEKLDLIDDVLYPQLRKSIVSMTSLLRRNDFEVVRTGMDVHSTVDVLIEVESMELPRERIHKGPPVNSPNSQEFLSKWDAAGLSKPFKEDGRWFVVVERRHRRADGLLRESISSLTLGKDIRKIQSFEIASGKQLLTNRYARLLTEYLDERMPWER